MASLTPDETSAILTRLSQKPGVQSTLILSRQTGAILRTSGLVPTKEDMDFESVLPVSATAYDRDEEHNGRNGLRSAEEVAKLVWKFFGAAGETAEEMMGVEDEVKLLRLRTRRNELVIVPDAKFLLVVIHSTPPA